MSNHSMILVLLLLTAAAAGCLAPEEESAYHAYGSKGWYTTGFAYNGRGIVPFDGPVYIAVNEARNEGSVVATGNLGPTTFKILFDAFSESKPFHDGGIASNLIEHGDSGVGDTSIPQVDLEMAGWGKATIQYDGKPYADPLTGNETWTAHFMVIRNGVRDNATGAIYADANKTDVYDPNDPGPGDSAMGDYEIHLVVRNGSASPAGSSMKGAEFETRAVVPQPSVSDERILFTVDELGSLAKVDFKVGDATTTGSNVTFTLRAPSGMVVLEDTLGDSAIAPGSGEQVHGHSLTTDELGPYVLTVTGRLNSGGYYGVKHSLEPPSAIVLNLWWEDVVFGQEAEERAQNEDWRKTTPRLR